MMPEDGAVRDPKSLLPVFDAGYALAIRGPYILIHELLNPLIKNKGEGLNSLIISERNRWFLLSYTFYGNV